MAACSVYDESLLVEKDVFDPTSCHLGDCWWSEETASGCRSADRPTVEERPGAAAAGADQELVVALDQVWLGETLPPDAPSGLAPWQAFGLDLDGVCTNPAECSAQPADAVSCASSGGPIADGALCRDNAFAKLFPTAAQTSLGSVYGISEDKIACGLKRGSYNLLLRVTGYSGGADDNNVRVDVFSSPGLPDPLPYECDDPTWKTQLGWIPSQAWKLDEAQLEAPPPDARSKLADPAAYVKNGYLVVHFLDGVELALPGDGSKFSGLSLELFKGVLLGRLEQDADQSWRIADGLIAGRIPRDRMLASVRRAGFCDTTAGAEYDQFLADLDAGLDVLGNGANAESAPCDALSVGIGFTARQATLGSPVAVLPQGECTGN